MLDKTDFLNLPQDNKPIIKDSIWEHLKFLSRRKSDNAVKSAQATFNKFKDRSSNKTLSQSSNTTTQSFS